MPLLLPPLRPLLFRPQPLLLLPYPLRDVFLRSVMSCVAVTAYDA